jgi:hypothetical protein
MSDNLVKFFLDAKERVIKVEIDGKPSKLPHPLSREEAQRFAKRFWSTHDIEWISDINPGRMI